MHAKRHSFIPMIMLTLVLQGCGGGVTGMVTYFYDGNPPVNGTEVTIVPTDDQAQTLDWDVYKAYIVDGLTKAGFVLTDGSSQPDLWCSVYYSIDAAGDVRTRTYSHTSTSGNTRVSNITSAIHQRVLILRFYNEQPVVPDPGQPTVEIRVVSEGESADLAAVMKALTKIAMYRWPGQEGKSYTVKMSNS